MNSRSAIRVSAGGESVGTHQIQNVMVHYRGVKYYKPNVGWEDFGTIAECEDPGCRIRKISNTDFWAEPS